MITSSTLEVQPMPLGQMFHTSSKDLKTLPGALIVLFLRLVRLEGYIRTRRLVKKSDPHLVTLRNLGLLKKRVQRCFSSVSFQNSQIVPFDVYILTLPRIGTDLLQSWASNSISLRRTLRTSKRRI